MSFGRSLGVGSFWSYGDVGLRLGVAANFMPGGGSVDQAIRAALGLAEGYLLDWRHTGGCQLVSATFSQLLPCPHREAKWQCEVVGSHTRHRWSDHLKLHERAGNGWHCSAVES